MTKCVAAAFLAAVLAAFYFLANALFDHSGLTNMAVLGLLVVVVLAGIPSRGSGSVAVVAGLLAGFVVFGLSHHMTGYLLTLKIAGWVSGGLVALSLVAVVVTQAPGWLQSFKPRSRAEYRADVAQMRQHNYARQQRASQARFERERQQTAAERQEKERARRRREGIRQRQRYSKHYQRQERHQQRLNLRRRLGIAPSWAAIPLNADVALIPEPADWSDPAQRRAYERAAGQLHEAEQMRLADLAVISLAEEQRQREERNARRIELCRRLGLHGLVPPAQTLPAPQTFARDPDGRTGRDDAGRVVEFIEGEGDTFIVIEPEEMKAEAARGGYEWEWSREPTIVARPVKKTRHQPPSHQGGPWL